MPVFFFRMRVLERGVVLFLMIMQPEQGRRPTDTCRLRLFNIILIIGNRSNLRDLKNQVAKYQTTNGFRWRIALNSGCCRLPLLFE